MVQQSWDKSSGALAYMYKMAQRAFFREVISIHSHALNSGSPKSLTFARCSKCRPEANNLRDFQNVYQKLKVCEIFKMLTKSKMFARFSKCRPKACGVGNLTSLIVLDLFGTLVPYLTPDESQKVSR